METQRHTQTHTLEIMGFTYYLLALYVIVEQTFLREEKGSLFGFFPITNGTDKLWGVIAG